MPTYETSDLEFRPKFTAGLEGAKDKIEYNNVTIVFDNVKDAVTAGARFVTWTLQRLAREGKLPHDREIRVNSKGEFEKTTAEKYADLTDAEKDELAELLKDRIKKTTKK